MNTLLTNITEALSAWHAGEGPAKNSHVPVLDAIAAAVQGCAEILVPVVLADDVFEGMDPETLKSGDTIHVDHEIHMRIQQLQKDGGGYYLPLFTDSAQVAKGSATSTINQPLYAMVHYALTQETCAGIVINPWENSATLSLDVLKKIADAFMPTQDEIAIRKVMELYLRGSNLGDSSVLKPAFHQDAVIYWDIFPTDIHTHAIQWFFDAIDSAGPDDDNDPPYSVNILDITGGLAVVKVQESWKKTGYTDYFSLVKADDGWKICAKLFHNHSAEQTAEI